MRTSVDRMWVEKRWDVFGESEDSEVAEFTRMTVMPRLYNFTILIAGRDLEKVIVDVTCHLSVGMGLCVQMSLRDRLLGPITVLRHVLVVVKPNMSNKLMDARP